SEREGQKLTVGLASASCYLCLDRGQGIEGLAQRYGHDEPAESLPTVDEALFFQHGERLAQSHPARPMSGGQLGFARQQGSWRVGIRGQRLTQGLVNRQVPQVSTHEHHISRQDRYK